MKPLIAFVFVLWCFLSLAGPVIAQIDAADALLQRGKFADAIDLFNSIITKDAKDYLALYKRSMAYNALGKSSAALSDLETSLSIRPGFVAAIAQRGKIRASRGDWTRAISDLKAANTEEAFLDTVFQAQHDADSAANSQEDGNYDACIDHSSSALNVATAMPLLNVLRAKCSIKKGDVNGAVGDLTRAVSLLPSTDLHVHLAKLLYFSLHESPINTLKKCLHYDPDSNACRTLMKSVRRMEADYTKASEALQQQQWHAAANILAKSGDGIVDKVRQETRQMQVDGLITSDCTRLLLAQVEEMTCQAYHEMNTHKLARSYCEAALELNPDSIIGLKARAQHQIQMEEFDQAINTLNRANELSQGQDRSVHEMLQRAQKLSRQAKTVDYYKVLQVPRDADLRTIKKAWRKLSREHHPDKVKDLDKETATKRYSEINTAYEVLSDENLRAQYDNGDDPFNPNQGGQPGHHGHPFVFRHGEGANFVFNGQGGGSHFKWHFQY